MAWSLTLSSEQLDRLREFGLSEYASRAYVALLQLGPTDARTVARAAKVPIAKVYSTLEQLQGRGLVEMIVDNPKRFAPVAFSDFLAHASETHVQEAARIQRLAPELLKLFDVPRREALSDRGSITLVRGRRSVLAKYRALADRAEESVFLCLSDGSARLTGNFRPIVESLAKRSVPIRALARVSADPRDAALDLRPFAELRLHEPRSTVDGSVGYGVFDAREALVTHFVPDDGSLHAGHDFGYLVTEVAVVRSLLDMLVHRWEGARPVLGVADAPAPRTRAK